MIEREVAAHAGPQALCLADVQHLAVCAAHEVHTGRIARGGAHAEALARGRAVRVSMNQTMADESAALSDGAEVAFFPPVTGG